MIIKKLKLRFIIAALLSVFLVLASTIAAINIANYLKTEEEANEILDRAILNERREFSNQFDFDMNGNMFARRDEDGYVFKDRGDVPRGQFFVTVFNSDNDDIWYTDFHAISRNKEADQSKAVEAYKSEESKGSVDNFRYKTLSSTETITFSGDWGENVVEFNVTYVAMIDMIEMHHGTNNYLISSIVVAVISYLIIALLIVLSSQAVFKTSEESYRKQKAFVTNASHELKTPLTIINADLELLEMDNGDNEWTDSIRDQVRRLTAMTNQLVTLSKLDENDLKNYPFDNVDVSNIAKETIDAFVPLYEKKNIMFSSDISDDVLIYGNKYLINELFYIFLDNALKYTKDNGELNVVVKKNNKKVEIIFANDTIDKEIDVNQIFERFYRSPSSNKKEGSGIGLSIAKEIVILHKGKISASINDDKIYFTLVI